MVECSNNSCCARLNSPFLHASANCSSNSLFIICITINTTARLINQIKISKRRFIFSFLMEFFPLLSTPFFFCPSPPPLHHLYTTFTPPLQIRSPLHDSAGTLNCWSVYSTISECRGYNTRVHSSCALSRRFRCRWDTFDPLRPVNLTQLVKQWKR